MAKKEQTSDKSKQLEPEHLIEKQEKVKPWPKPKPKGEEEEK